MIPYRRKVLALAVFCLITALTLQSERASATEHEPELVCPPEWDYNFDGRADGNPSLLPAFDVHELDENGILQTKSYHFKDFRKLTINVVGYGTRAVVEWCKTGDKKDLAIAKAQARWLLDNLIRKNGLSGWYSEEPAHDLTGSWTSALSNGVGIGFLAQISIATGDKSYLEPIPNILEGFRIDVSKGGLKTTMFDGSIFYEEYPGSKEITAVLNGHLIALGGIAYYAEHFEDKEAEQIFELGVEAVNNFASQYDAGYTTYYALGIGTYPEPIRQPNHYAHRIHIEGLKWLSKRAPERYRDRFSKISQRWIRYRYNYFYERKKFRDVIINSDFERGTLFWRFNAATWFFRNGYWTRTNPKSKDEAIGQVTVEPAKEGEPYTLNFWAENIGQVDQIVKARVLGQRSVFMQKKFEVFRFESSFECKFVLSQDHGRRYFSVSGKALKNWARIGVDFRLSEHGKNPTVKFGGVSLTKGEAPPCSMPGDLPDGNLLLSPDMTNIKHWRYDRKSILVELNDGFMFSRIPNKKLRYVGQRIPYSFHIGNRVKASVLLKNTSEKQDKFRLIIRDRSSQDRQLKCTYALKPGEVKEVTLTGLTGEWPQPLFMFAGTNVSSQPLLKIYKSTLSKYHGEKVGCSE